MWIALSIFLAVACLVIHVIWSRRAGSLANENLELKAALNEASSQFSRSEEQGTARQLAIFNSMVEGILILDARGRIQTVNHALERLFNTTRDVRGMTLMEAFRTHELSDVAQVAQAEGVVRDYELTLKGLQHTRYLQVNAAVIQDAGQGQKGLILIFHDFTRIKQLESIRKEFVANVSHELRTPLTLIKGFVETLIDGAKDDPEVTGKFLLTIQKHTNRLAFLIEDLLTLSHLESGQVIMHRQETLLYPLVERVLDGLQSAAAQKRMTFENAVPGKLNANVDGDRIQQVLYNLLDNAIKYGREGGNVRIEAAPRPGAVEVSVADDGPGIPAEARERIFERFYRVDRARSRDAGGTGLGLAIVKHIVQAHGGKVWVESVLEKGSTFRFTLPA